MEDTKEKMKTDKTKRKPKCFKKVNGQIYEMDSRYDEVGYVPRAKKEKKELLKKMICSKLRQRWMTIPAKVSTLERVLITELIDSL